MKKIVYIISNINKALSFEWTAVQLNKGKYDLQFILLNPGTSELETFLNQQGIPVKRIRYRGKKDVPAALFKTYKYLKKTKPDIVHTHLFDAGIIGLTAAQLAGVKKRIYTRHHSEYHHLYYPKAVKYDRYNNYMATDIVAISQVVKQVLLKKEFVDEKKIHLIHHGFLFSEPITAQKKEALRLSYNLLNQFPVVGVISRYIELKGVQHIIVAFRQVLETYPDALLLLTNVGGNYTNEIQELLKTIPEKNYRQLPFASDIAALYQLFDLFIHVPIGPDLEAFGQTYVEALAAGIPSVFTLSGIAHEFIIDRENALVVPYKDSKAIYQAIITLLSDKTLANKLIINGKKDVFSKFNLNKMISKLEELYT